MVYSINITKGSRNTSAGANGVLKAVNGVNGIPISIAPGFPDLQDQFNQMGIKDIRLHDCFGIADVDDGFVANRTTNQNQLIPNVPAASQAKAKTFIADLANKRTIYPYAAAGMRANNLALASQNANFEPTDSYLKRILDNDASVNPNNIQREVFFRIGRTLDGGWEMPENFDIYATLVGNIVRRYAINYQSVGLPRKVTYWEIWNEPDLTVFWNNNVASNYYTFYSKIVNVIKSIDPSAKVAGSAVAAGYNPGGVYLDGFLNYCRNTNTPIDFISWHYYGNLTGDPQNILDASDSVRRTLTIYGYDNLESICSEWNSTPFGSAYTYSRVQSAQNAAYISSVLMYMQYCKVDRAHYYRADASSFGLFNNNPQPNNTAYKSFCSYAAQSFGLFSKLLNETPYILNQTNDFTTGLTTLAAENAAGNKMNILASNYKVDLDFTLAKTAPTVAYQQHYLDANRTTDQLNDDWSKNEWFGGKNPNSLTYDNTVTQNPAVDNTPQYGADGELTARPRNYTQSNTGAGFQITNIASNYTGYTLTAYRIKEGGRLDRMTPEEVTSSISASMSNGTLSITDTGATLSTVTLYSVEFTTNGNNNNCDNDKIYEVYVPFNTLIPLNNIFPASYKFTPYKQYKITLVAPICVSITCCTSGYFDPKTQNCGALPKAATYSFSKSIFTPFIPGMSGSDTYSVGAAFVQGSSITGSTLMRYKITPL